MPGGVDLHGWADEDAEDAAGIGHTGPVAVVQHPGSIAVVAWEEEAVLLEKHEQGAHPDSQDLFAWSEENADRCGLEQPVVRADLLLPDEWVDPIEAPKEEDVASGEPAVAAGHSEQGR